MGYVIVLSNGEVNPCMLLQVNLGNIREQSIMSIWGNSPILTRLRQRDLVKGECGVCNYRLTCSAPAGLLSTYRCVKKAGDRFGLQNLKILGTLTLERRGNEWQYFKGLPRTYIFTG